MALPARHPPSVVRNILFLLTGIHIHPLYLLIPVMLSLASAAFEGVSLGLLIPMLNGFLKRDFSFIVDIPGLSVALSLLPASLKSNDRALFGTLVAFFVTAVFLKNTLKYLSVLSMSYVATRAQHHLRKTIFGRYLSFGKLYFDQTSVGQNTTALTQFTDLALWPILMIHTFMNAFFSLSVYLMLMFLISWQLTVFAMPLFLLLHVSVRTIIGEIRRISASTAERGAMLGKKTVEILSTIPLVKAYSSEREEQIRYSRVSDEKAWLDFHASRLKDIVAPLQEMITLLSTILLFIGMLYLTVRHQVVEPTVFIVYFYLVLNASTKFGALTHFRGTLASAYGPVQSLVGIFDDTGKHIVPDGRVEFRGLRDAIEFRDLSFSYPGRADVLSGVRFTVPKGTMAALVGPTGSGKSTIIHLLLRLYDPPAGSILVDGSDIRDFTLTSLHNHMALVSQETLLLHDTLRANITYGLDSVPEEQLREVVERARLREFVERLPQGLETLIGDRGVQLSGGEKQRVSIARALLKGAEILILDEATSALDTQTEKLIQEAIDEAVRGRTTIVIAHRLSTIQHADRIVVLEDGNVSEEGHLEELLQKNGRFHTLWEQQKFD